MFLGSLRKRLAASRQAWEAVCLRCGMCCHDRDPDPQGVLIVHLSSPCRYLDRNTKLCTIYERRLRLCGECRKVTVFHALFSRYLPDDCGYARRYVRWRRLFLRSERQLPQD